MGFPDIQTDADIPEEMKNKFIEILTTDGNQHKEFEFDIQPKVIIATPKDPQSCPVQLQCTFSPAHELEMPVFDPVTGEEIEGQSFVQHCDDAHFPWVTILPNAEGKYTCSPSLEKCGLEHLIMGTFETPEFQAGLKKGLEKFLGI